MLTFDKIDHLHLHVSKREVAEQWYLEYLGFSRIVELEHWADEGPLTLSNNGIHLALFENRKPQKATIAFSVSSNNFIAWKNHLKSKGILIKLMDHQLSWSMYFSDPDGNPFEITSYQYQELTKELNQSTLLKT